MTSDDNAPIGTEEKVTLETMDFSDAVERSQQIKQQIELVLYGQDRFVNEVLACFLVGGHVLVEGVPGLGKTLLVKALAKCFEGDFKRIQFTPDLMPSDVTGHSLYNLKEEKFVTRKGPIFTNLLLADEINRAPAKTQSALLEVMQERMVTIDQSAYQVPSPFMVLATQNPIEQDGTYPLPEAELDRFLIKALVDFPSFETELHVAEAVLEGKVSDTLSVDDLTVVVNSHQLNAIGDVIRSIRIEADVLRYGVQLVRTTRDTDRFSMGAGPRATIALIKLAQANAFLQGRSFVIPDDMKQVAIPVLRHRVALSPEQSIEGRSVDENLRDEFENVPAPRIEIEDESKDGALSS